jgi:hypothetical protein
MRLDIRSMQVDMVEFLTECVRRCTNRFALWAEFIDRFQVRTMAELGVFRGEFAEQMLRGAAAVERYYMVDPWRHLAAWNKPANESDEEFVRIQEEALLRTDFAREKVSVLRGRTVDVIDRIPDGSLDFAYVDGDHTLKGITQDLIGVYAKIRPGGYIAGDDFSRDIWQHAPAYEPTLVFPYAVYFAEAVGATLYALPMNQFLLHKPETAVRRFAFVDLTGRYGDLSLLGQVRPNG